VKQNETFEKPFAVKAEEMGGEAKKVKGEGVVPVLYRPSCDCHEE
jgi:hypothetical protein